MKFFELELEATVVDRANPVCDKLNISEAILELKPNHKAELLGAARDALAVGHTKQADMVHVPPSDRLAAICVISELGDVSDAPKLLQMVIDEGRGAHFRNDPGLGALFKRHGITLNFESFAVSMEKPRSNEPSFSWKTSTQKAGAYELARKNPEVFLGVQAQLAAFNDLMTRVDEDGKPARPKPFDVNTKDPVFDLYLQSDRRAHGSYWLDLVYDDWFATKD